ncbi:hypothetical protein BDE02_01G095100 [Populus trichocarpa]|uniref:HMA domain-containing protein n=1 Tax=Populus trichocarpa TaxID=3694 RepID=A0A2K2BVK4_POPTR|nr:hypothetical protein BDE02_01G095100 [Populus trichocarpa]
MFSVTGMTCSACAGSVEKAIKRLPGVLEAIVDVLNNRAQVMFFPSFTNIRVQQLLDKVFEDKYSSKSSLLCCFVLYVKI